MTPGTHLTTNRPTDPIEHAALAELRHNLRTPVNHILGYSELLIEDASEARNSAALEILRQIHSTTRGALADINSALANRLSVERAEVDALCEKVRPRVDRIAHCIEHLREDAPLPVDGIRARLPGGERILLRFRDQRKAKERVRRPVNLDQILGVRRG